MTDRNPVTGAPMTTREKFDADYDASDIPELIELTFANARAERVPASEFSGLVAQGIEHGLETRVGGDYRQRSPLDAPHVVTIQPRRYLELLIAVIVFAVSVYGICIVVGKAGF